MLQSQSNEWLRKYTGVGELLVTCPYKEFCRISKNCGFFSAISAINDLEHGTACRAEAGGATGTQAWEPTSGSWRRGRGKGDKGVKSRNKGLRKKKKKNTQSRKWPPKCLSEAVHQNKGYGSSLVAQWVKDRMFSLHGQKKKNNK